MAPDNQVELIGFWTRYSSWTSRISILLRYYQIPHKATITDLEEAKRIAESDLIPVLKASLAGREVIIRDSLAIAEFLAETNPELPLWPKDEYLRALARSAVAQMHSGFPELRSVYHTNFVAKYTGAVPVSDKARKEVAFLLALWADSRKRTVARLKELGVKDDGFLFGSFGITDAFFWPVLWRIRTYNLPLDGAEPEALAWMKTMWGDPKIRSLEIRQNYLELERPETAVARYDDLFKDRPDVQYGSFTEDWEFAA